MMQTRDWISGIVGAVIFLLGLFPMLGRFSFLNEWPVPLLTWIVAGAGFYLAINSIIEITNSNIMGTISIIIAGLVLVVSLLPALNGLGWLGDWASISWIGETVYKIILVIEGVFLAIATFAMEL